RLGPGTKPLPFSALEQRPEADVTKIGAPPWSVWRRQFEDTRAHHRPPCCLLSLSRVSVAPPEEPRDPRTHFDQRHQRRLGHPQHLVMPARHGRDEVEHRLEALLGDWRNRRIALRFSRAGPQSRFRWIDLPRLAP